MNANLLAQSALSGLFSGGLYALLGLGLSLSWRFLRIINLSHFAMIFLAAYLTYQCTAIWKINPYLVPLFLIPVFFVVAALQQLAIIRFGIDEFGSIVATFGVTIVVEALLQLIWSADFLRLETDHLKGSMVLGSLLVPWADAFMFMCAVTTCVGAWGLLRFTYIGKALRANVENPAIASIFGVQSRRLSLLVAGSAGGLAAFGGVFIALLFALTPSQMYSWFGVIFATVIMGGLGSPLGVLMAGLLVGVSESFAMALVAPSWAPIVPFTLMVSLLTLRPGRI
ncbi:branched-chain amino acid ABC transporter permease [Bradyrhizobium sp. 23AC]